MFRKTAIVVYDTAYSNEMAMTWNLFLLQCATNVSLMALTHLLLYVEHQTLKKHVAP